MNLELSTPNLQELEQIVDTLIAEAKCACHIINPHKTRILLWKQVKDKQEIYHLRIGIQKFTSQAQTDRNGETYWRMYNIKVKKEDNQTATELNNYEQSKSTEPAINSSTS